MLEPRYKINNLDIESLLLWSQSGSMSSLYDVKEDWHLPEVFYSAAVTVDLETELIEKTVEDLRNSASLISFQLMEIQKLKKLIEKINALEEVSGLLNDLSPDKIESFDNSVKRRALFK